MPPLILLLEDEASIADSIVYALKTEGIDTLWKTTGREGIAALNECKADAVILDVGLPDMSGFEVCKAIRRVSDIPVLFLTARGDEIDRVVGFELGADDYVVKPFSPRELTARIKAILKRAKNGQASKGTAPAGFDIDDSACRIAWQGKALDLTRYEYRLLQVLLGKPDRVFSRSQLMEQVWESPESSLERTVDAHIKSLRAKLREAGVAGDPIRTHRGMGYSFQVAP